MYMHMYTYIYSVTYVSIYTHTYIYIYNKKHNIVCTYVRAHTYLSVCAYSRQIPGPLDVVALSLEGVSCAKGLLALHWD